MVRLNDVLKDLPHLYWRGILLPCSGRRVSFGNQIIMQGFDFRDLELCESRGRKNWRLEYDVPSREGIAAGPYAQMGLLFIMGYKRLLDACLDRSPGTLDDPILGGLRATLENYDEALEAAKRDGVDIKLSFVQSPTQEDVAGDAGFGVSSLQSVTDEAGALNAEIVDLPDDAWVQEQAPDGLIDILDVPSAIFGQFNLATDRASAQIHNLAYRIEKTQYLMEKSMNPKLWGMGPALLRLKGSCLQALQSNAADSPAIKRKLTPRDMSIDAVAEWAGMTIDQLLKPPNGDLARYVTVPVNTAVWVAV